MIDDAASVVRSRRHALVVLDAGFGAQRLA